MTRRTLETLARRSLAVMVSLCLAASVASSLQVHPHSLAYFNEAAGGPENGWRHMLGSNFDWGQDLLVLMTLHESSRDVYYLDFSANGRRTIQAFDAGTACKPLDRCRALSSQRLSEKPSSCANVPENRTTCSISNNPFRTDSQRLLAVPTGRRVFSPSATVYTGSDGRRWTRGELLALLLDRYNRSDISTPTIMVYERKDD